MRKEQAATFWLLGETAPLGRCPMFYGFSLSSPILVPQLLAFPQGVIKIPPVTPDSDTYMVLSFAVYLAATAPLRPFLIPSFDLYFGSGCPSLWSSRGALNTTVPGGEVPQLRSNTELSGLSLFFSSQPVVSVILVFW